MSLTVTIREVTDGAAAWALGEAWDEVLARSVSPVYFLTRSFQQIWWESLGDGRLWVMLGEAGDRLEFIAPFYIAEVAELGRTVRSIGGTEVADYLDLIASPDSLAVAWRLVFNQLAAATDQWETFELRALPEWSASRTIVAELASAYGWSCEVDRDEVCPLIALAPTWEGYLAGLRKKDRHELRRKIGRLERATESESFGLVGPDDDLQAAIDDFFSLHRKSGQDKEGFWNERLERFFQRLIRASHADGTLRLAFQCVNGQRVAAVLSFRFGDRYYVYNSGYDPAYRDLGVGVVCMGRTIKAAIAEGAAIFDLLQGDESYKYDFGAADTTVYRCRIQRPKQ